MPNVLVVDDERDLVSLLDFNLRQAGYETTLAYGGEEALSAARRRPPHLVLLDLMLPDLYGTEVCRQLKADPRTRSVPVVMLTARGSEVDRVVGFELGADDYVVKPFSVRELLARVEAVLRRSPERPQPVADSAIPGGNVDYERREIRFDDGTRAELSEREVELLRYLAANPGRAISRDEILQRVWRLDPRRVETRTIDVHVANLRAKLRDDGAAPRVVLTVRGKGYMLAHGP